MDIIGTETKLIPVTPGRIQHRVLAEEAADDYQSHSSGRGVKTFLFESTLTCNWWVEVMSSAEPLETSVSCV